MAIRGIDTQIMMNRLPDNVKDTSELLKRPEVLQDLLGNQGRLNDAQDQSRVAKLSEAEMEQIRADVDESSANDYEGSESQRRENEEETEKKAAQELYVPKERHIVDIRI